MIKKLSLCLLITVSANAQKIILWDIHNVLLQRSPSKTIGSIFSADMASAIWKLNWELVKKAINLGLSALMQDTSGETFAYLAQEYDNEPLKQVIIDITNAQTANHEIQPIIEELDTLGFEHHIGSNIGQTAFKELIDSNKHPEFQHIFSFMDLSKSRVVEYEPDLIKKPDPRFFTSYLKRNHLDPKKNRIIFIDDLESNVNAANEVGLDGIIFKDANQLRNELRKRNIPIAPPQQKNYQFQAYQQLFT